MAFAAALGTAAGDSLSEAAAMLVAMARITGTSEEKARASWERLSARAFARAWEGTEKEAGDV